MRVNKHYLISGRVQEVGYRAFAKRAADQFSLKGWVRNLTDLRVEILVAGDRNLLERFEIELNRGPSHALVETVKSEIVVSSDVGENFVIAPTGVAEWFSKV
jgi:acylphosphatase